MASTPLSQPREFPTSGFTVLDSSRDFEEETLPGYVKERYYPVRIGEVFRSRYQVVTKLGFGSSSTVWLCRDLCDGQYLVLKVHARTMRKPSEVQISNHLKAVHDAHGVEKYPNNILLGIDDKTVLAYMEEDEITNPAPRKFLDDRTIYATRAMPLTSGEPILADLGEARLAEERQTGLIMPDVYRAPEVMLGMDWDRAKTWTLKAAKLDVLRKWFRSWDHLLLNFSGEVNNALNSGMRKVIGRVRKRFLNSL
ncbi:uncharacterized protein ACLA_071630 [Aspergillus clavatus NRRL 1]|uniref:non-specific serine/threonine protein kinase n=1 Tax=Aspergillus clavatus (strain ATCC 1007 / CBS 513.65 / DSM 816 / NCTC 3887 / NRRL 1 / QM 1276 / 107) TaxID=344612 RepID=A1C6V9_ASPCL|nr:uncharacterized protein ACLA_071630 [Aspergillus clavatus NRRL 1]EAW14130.1 hypothetical protein ACLA_071630 [Aspergillus clavatus NRRL 1]